MTRQEIIKLYQDRINEILDRYGSGVRHSWVSAEIAMLRENMRYQLEKGNSYDS